MKLVSLKYVKQEKNASFLYFLILAYSILCDFLTLMCSLLFFFLIKALFTPEKSEAAILADSTQWWWYFSHKI